MSLFEQLSQLIHAKGERLTIEIIGADNGEIKARITPELGPTPSNASDEEVNLRALMATPITIIGTPEQADNLLAEHITKRAPIQASGANALNELAAKMAAATEKAKAAKTAKAGNTEKTPTEKAKNEFADRVEASSEKAKAAKTAKAPTLDDGF